MREFKKLPLELFIGYDIEQNSRVIELDASEMVEKYPSGILQLVCKRPGEETTYIAPSFEQDGGTLRWTLTSYDVEKAGQGLAIVALVDTSEESVKVLASHKIRTGIEEGLHFRDAETVDPEDSLIARVLAAVSQAQAYAQDAAEALGDVQDEHDQAIADIEAKGAETLASIPSDYTTLSGDVSDLKSALNDVENGVYYDSDLDWSELLTTYPSGWRKGYFYGEVGNAYAVNNNSNNYIRSAGSIRLGNGGGMTGDIAYLEFIPPAGYSIQVTEARNSDNVIVSQKGYRNSQAHPEVIDAHIVYKFNSEYRYVVNVGYFADGDAATKAADTNFTNTIKCKIYKYRSKKLPWTSKLQYFKVPINKKDLFAPVADELIEENVDCVLGLPTSYTNDGKPTKLIFMHHGQSGTVSADNETWYPESSVWPNFITEYLNAGYAVFDVNGSGAYNGDADTDANHQDYGCPNAIQAAFKAYTYIINNYNIDPHIFVHGSSMGAVLAYSFAKVHANIVDAIGLFSPALLFLSATGQSDLSQDSLNAIAVNYGYSSAAEMVSDGYKNLLQCSPFITFVDSDGAIVEKPYSYNWVDNYEADSLGIKCSDITIPIKIWCGSADTSVNPKNGKALTKALKNTWRTSYFREIQGANHSAGLGGNATVRTEAVLWFKRFT